MALGKAQHRYLQRIFHWAYYIDSAAIRKLRLEFLIDERIAPLLAPLIAHHLANEALALIAQIAATLTTKHSILDGDL